MADNKKYYYIKLKENFFDDDAMIILESMQDGYLYSNILLKLYLKSLKYGGRLMFNERIPYNPTILSQVTRHSVGVVEKALGIFRELGLIDVLDNGAIYMLDIQNYIGQSSTEADRQREYYSKIKIEKVAGELPCKKSYMDSCEVSVPEIEIEKEIELETDTEIEVGAKKDGKAALHPSNPDYEFYQSTFNTVCTNLSKCKVLTEKRRKAIRDFEKQMGKDSFEEVCRRANDSAFCAGSNDRSWKADFDFLIRVDKAANVLEGKYDGKGTASGQVSNSNTGKSADEKWGIKPTLTVGD